MSSLKYPKVGVYGPKTRNLQKRVSFERTSLTWKTIKVYKYLGSRRNNSPSLLDIDEVFSIVADRAYATESIEINAYVQPLQESPLNLDRFGIIDPLQDQQLFRIHINSFKADGLGRYIIPGDIIEVPFFKEDGNLAYFEIDDVDRKQVFENYFVTVLAKPITNKQQVAEIPNIPDNNFIMDAIEDKNENFANSDVELEGIQFNYTGYIEPGYVDTDYFYDSTYTLEDEVIRTHHDVRKTEQSDFLDATNTEII